MFIYYRKKLKLVVAYCDFYNYNPAYFVRDGLDNDVYETRCLLGDIKVYDKSIINNDVSIYCIRKTAIKSFVNNNLIKIL